MNMNPLIGGAIGGAALPVMRAGLALTHQSKDTLEMSFSYIVGILLLAALGGGTVWVLRETKLQKAFILGLSLPGTITSLVGTAPGSAAGDKGSASAFNWLTLPLALISTPAYAAEPPPRVPPPLMTSSAMARQFRIDGDTAKVRIDFLDDSGKRLEETPVQTANGYTVPDSAAMATITSPSGVKRTVNLSNDPGSVTTTKVSLEKTKSYGFLQALGVSAKVEEQMKADSKIAALRKPGSDLWIKLPAGNNWISDVQNNLATAKTFLPVRETRSERQFGGVLLPGDKFRILSREKTDAGDEWIRIKLLELAAAPRGKGTP